MSTKRGVHYSIKTRSEEPKRSQTKREKMLEARQFKFEILKDPTGILIACTTSGLILATGLTLLDLRIYLVQRVPRWWYARSGYMFLSPILQYEAEEWDKIVSKVEHAYA